MLHTTQTVRIGDLSVNDIFATKTGSEYRVDEFVGGSVWVERLSTATMSRFTKETLVTPIKMSGLNKTDQLLSEIMKLAAEILDDDSLKEQTCEACYLANRIEDLDRMMKSGFALPKAWTK
jgi:hypothetical protein